MTDVVSAAQPIRHAFVEAVDVAWSRFGWGRGEERVGVTRPTDWESSVRRIFLAGLQDVEFMVRAVDITMRRANFRDDNSWAYWCGVCWRHLEQLQARAREIVEAEEAQWRG